MSYPKRITLKMYERQALMGVRDCGVGIIRGGAESHVLFRMRSIISIYNIDLSAGTNRAGDVVVWARDRWKTANEATTGAGEEAKIVYIEDTRPQRFKVDKVLNGDARFMSEIPREQGRVVVDYEDMIKRINTMAEARWSREKNEGTLADLDDIMKELLNNSYPGTGAVDMFNKELDRLRKEEVDDSSKVL